MHKRCLVSYLEVSMVCAEIHCRKYSLLYLSVRKLVVEVD
jgi:hypothetical protein